ncbi:hypothetical protein SAMN05216243_2310 [Sediminibacillus albus]|uniref:Uncharacterized protein n=1 Tax=Sediminibacillus albus TaxID=407036 RepID=A0A1G9A1X1_9BACI|nr:hypothetical protein SAMN05216243_2310 [Sediminibacillus albus]
MGRLLKRLIKWGPLIYPVIRKFRNKSKTNAGSRY